MKFVRSQSVIIKKSSPRLFKKKVGNEICHSPVPQSSPSLRFQSPKCGAGPQPGINHMQNSVKMLICQIYIHSLISLLLSLFSSHPLMRWSTVPGKKAQ